MKQIDATQLLNQIRTLGHELQPTAPIGEIPKSGFSELLKSSIESVNEIQKDASSLKVGFENGTTEKSLAEVMIAAQKADLSFRAVTEVRNKLVTAYQDIMNMPV